MTIISRITWGFMISAGLLACSGENASDAPARTAGRQTLRATGACDFESCGAVPSSLGSAASLDCNGAPEACQWSASSSDVTSYRFCAETECPARPDIECPANTVRVSQQCGSLDGAACAWATSCAPPRQTTACPSATGCDDLPLLSIGVICQDGSTGGFDCVTDGAQCRWERNCD